MRALTLLFVAACASPTSGPALAEPTAPMVPPTVTVGDPAPVVMAPATAPPPETRAPKGHRLRRNGAGAVPIYTDDPTRGDDLALVTVVVFTDYECPPCAMALPTLAAVQAELGDDSVRLVHKHFPLQFHPRARPAAEAAVAVHQLGGQDAFEAFHERILENQSAISDDQLRAWAAEAGVSTTELDAFLNGTGAATKVDRDIALARELEVPGVPDVRINCHPLDGPVDAPTLRSAITAEQRHAEEALKRGTPRDAIYQARCGD